MKRPEQIQACVDYVLDVLLGPETREQTAAFIYYGSEPVNGTGRGVFITASGFFAGGYGQSGSAPVLPLAEVDGVPLLFGTPDIRHDGGRLIINADIIASAFFLLTRYEEWIRPGVRDAYGRFPGRESLPYRAGFINRPVVDEYARLLRGWLKEAGIDAVPDAGRFRVLLTHDVDALRSYRGLLWTAAGTVLGKQPTAYLFDNFMISTGLRRDPLNNIFTDILDMDKQASLTVADTERIWFFLAGGRNTKDGMYRIGSRDARALMTRIKEDGAGIGLHASYSAGREPERLKKEKETLVQACGDRVDSCRYHYLGWRNIGDGRQLAAAGITRDATLGYADVPGFRLGTCRPFPLFDPERCEPLGIEEHPLQLMDVTFDTAQPRGMNLSLDEAKETADDIIAQVRKHNGEVVTLWHCENLLPVRRTYQRELYRHILASLSGGEGGA